MTGVAELRTYGGVDGERRRADRRARVLDAGLDLLAADGTELTVRGVCRVAGVATRYFYENFADRDALADAVYDRIVADLVAATSSALDRADGPLPVRVRAAVEAVLAVVADDPRTGRVLFGPGHAARRAAAAPSLARLFAARSPDPDELTGAFAVGGLSHVVHSWLAGEVTATREQVVDRCTALLVALHHG
ncbi:transcriptional regulator, TetR family [Pseudonocardia ammonioxydans]|uniref:Transcriptional regulator, TetR family n=1 Tax=Pseudonocardia ammonioxydans TaxID=260086 RepID=A0A1I5H2W8_PSUAM|nr:transcriptional regulator, TetR family [Pseudonocardia ammonioxydans]